MNKRDQLTFQKADFAGYAVLLQDESIRHKVASFLLKYVMIEAFYKKLLIMEREKNGKKLTKEDIKKLGVRKNDVHRVLSYFDIITDDSLIERVFGSNDNNYMECSIKKLRDRLVHNVNSNVLKSILERYTIIEKDLDSFLMLLEGTQA